VANDKNQYLKGPEFATSIGLLMESLKIRDKKILPTEEEIIEEAVTKAETSCSTNCRSRETSSSADRRSYKTKRRS
jgi:cell division protein FtsA